MPSPAAFPMMWALSRRIDRGPMGGRITLYLLKRGVLLFWALWFALALATNAFDALKAAGALAAGWSFASGNYAFMREVTAVHGAGPWLTNALFAGVLVWEGLAFWLHGRAVVLFRDPGCRRPAVVAFAVSLALWSAFILADEVFIAYAVEATHMRLFVAELVSLLVVLLLPDEA